MEYTLKDKLDATKDFIEELTEKGWQEIEYLQSQLTNLADTEENKKVGKLLNSLLTSYYVFVGGLENLDNSESYTVSAEPNIEPCLAPESYEKVVTNTSLAPEDKQDYAEPFEYFVDFEEPTGDPITDDDLYNN
jgi:hypothetical protein